MYIREEIEMAMERHKNLFLLWTSATVLLVAANYSVALSFGLGVVLFMLGALNLSAAGITCAYRIAKDNV